MWMVNGALISRAKGIPCFKFPYLANSNFTNAGHKKMIYFSVQFWFRFKEIVINKKKMHQNIPSGFFSYHSSLAVQTYCRSFCNIAEIFPIINVSDLKKS